LQTFQAAIQTQPTPFPGLLRAGGDTVAAARDRAARTGTGSVAMVRAADQAVDNVSLLFKLPSDAREIPTNTQ
jgi:hypothetical protein